MGKQNYRTVCCHHHHHHYDPVTATAIRLRGSHKRLLISELTSFWHRREEIWQVCNWKRPPQPWLSRGWVWWLLITPRTENQRKRTGQLKPAFHTLKLLKYFICKSFLVIITRFFKKEKIKEKQVLNVHKNMFLSNVKNLLIAKYHYPRCAY